VDCLKHFNGEFAFAILDRRQGLLFLARDRVGIKPLYFSVRGDRLWFASEIKALLPEVGAEPNQEVIENDYQVFESTWDDLTLFKNIYQVLPGHYLIWRNETLADHEYWNVPLNQYDFVTREDDLVEKLRYLLVDSVRLRLRSDVPWGVYLSGGLDSGIIACVAQPRKVFSVNFPQSSYGEKYDESAYARTVSQHISAEHYWVYPTPEGFLESIEDVIWHMDQPCATMAQYPQFLMAKEAARHVKVVLGGQGADELWGGYVRHLLLHIERRLGAAMFNGEAFCAEGLQQFRFYEPLVRHIWSDGLFEPPDKRYFRIVNRSFPRDVQTMTKWLKHFHSCNHYIDKMLYADFKTSLIPLLQVEDRVNAAASIESRLPMLDHRLIEFAFQVPPELKFKSNLTKYLLRQAAKGIVPAHVIDRKDKIGFPVPVNQWFRKELRGYVEDLLAGLRRRGIEAPSLDDATLPGAEFNRAVWANVMLELWFRVFVDRSCEAGRRSVALRTETAMASR
jgi:asparagine synthase (glutamine-hydrolysing)